MNTTKINLCRQKHLFGLGWFHQPLLQDRIVIVINNNNNNDL